MSDTSICYVEIVFNTYYDAVRKYYKVCIFRRQGKFSLTKESKDENQNRILFIMSGLCVLTIGMLVFVELLEY